MKPPIPLYSTALAVRLLAESFATERGYCPKTLVTMCSTVSAGLVVALCAKGFEASMVAGYFDDGGPQPWGHFWVEVITVSDLGDPIVWIVDVTATQFADWASRCRPRVVTIARYDVGNGKRYRLTETNDERVDAMIQPHDWDDVAEFRRRSGLVRWIREAA